MSEECTPDCSKKPRPLEERFNRKGPRHEHRPQISGSSSPDLDAFQQGGPYKAFGVSRRAFGVEPLIDFATRDGNHHVITHSHLYDVTFNASDGVEITFSNHVVTRKERCFKQGYEPLMRQHIVWIAEATGAQRRRLGDGQPVIFEIRIRVT